LESKFMSYLTPIWPASPRVRAFTSTRHPGFSRPPYDSFNLATHVGDDEMAVARNREKLRQDLSLPSIPYWLQQAHTTVAVEVNESVIEPRADASYTAVPHKICVALTADCLPLLICNKDATLVAAIHAGWRGLADGVIEATIVALQQKFNVNGSDLLVWFGPAIGAQAFVVGADVCQAFVSYDAAAAQALMPINSAADQEPKWYADVYAIARQRLAHCGVSDAQMYGGDLCTYSDEARFFSFRRDKTQRKLSETGRMASLIWLE
jgi:polyphenol oxidase